MRIMERYDTEPGFSTPGDDDDGSTSGLMGWIQKTDLKNFAKYALIAAFVIIIISIILHHFLGVKAIKKF